MLKIKSFPILFLLLFLVTFSSFSQTENNEDELSLDSGTLDSQFEYVIQKSNSWRDERGQNYEVIKWKKLLPQFVFDLNYEEVINSPEEQIRNLLKKCELSWDKNCLKFYNNKRPIKTASDTQVRSKIYKSSVDSWKNFQPYMNDFFQDLPD